MRQVFKLQAARWVQCAELSAMAGARAGCPANMRPTSRWALEMYMRFLCTALLVVLAAASISACSSEHEALRTRAMIWDELLVGLNRMSEAQAVDEIERLIEPSIGRSLRAREYYRSRTSSAPQFVVLKSSVDEISFDSGGATATVRYTSIYREPSGGTRTASQLTRWRKVDGVWYRAVVDADVRFNN
jgi:hypothetical protein